MLVCVIGSGSWGTAIAHLLGEKGYDVSLWSHNADDVLAINETHKNPRYLPAVELSRARCTNSVQGALQGCDAVAIVCPSAHVRSIARQMASSISPELPVIVLSKGLEQNSGLTMIDVVEDVLGSKERLACLAGPNHAEEVSLKRPSATVVASANETCANFFQELFSAPYFRVYTSDDCLGVELCAAAKNVIAIASGMCAAMELGDNASAALMTRGLAEAKRLVVALGGQERTCLGLAGMGDLIATCSSIHSRNRTLGEMLVSGKSLSDFEKKTHMVAEGAIACRTVTDLAREHDVELPICEIVRSVLYEGLDPHNACGMLFDRPSKPENY